MFLVKNSPTKNILTKNYPKRKKFLSEEFSREECSYIAKNTPEKNFLTKNVPTKNSPGTLAQQPSGVKAFLSGISRHICWAFASTF
jgi:hypothetical protein